jgi:ankyrin repeat protein
MSIYFFKKENIDQKDNRRKTPLELAILLKHIECANILCQFGADCNIITKQGWNCELDFRLDNLLPFL